MTASAACARSRIAALAWVVLGIVLALLVGTLSSETGSSTIKVNAPVAVGDAETRIAPATTGNQHAYDPTEQHFNLRTTTRLRELRRSWGSPPVIAGPEEAGVAAEAGSSAAATAGADQAPVVIGRNMAGRVIPHAKSIGAEWYEGAPADVPPTQWLQHNAEWLQEQMDSGRQVIDIGEDPASFTPSPNYDMEQQMLQGYSNYLRVFLDEPERYLMATAH